MEGISIVREVMAGTGDNQGEIRPGPDYTDSAELRRFLPNIVHSVYHPVGTCRIGSDERAVVDPQLRVRGVEGCGSPTRRSCRRSPEATPTRPRS